LGAEGWVVEKEYVQKKSGYVTGIETKYISAMNQTLRRVASDTRKREYMLC
jgi:hypothetical protein